MSLASVSWLLSCFWLSFCCSRSNWTSNVASPEWHGALTGLVQQVKHTGRMRVESQGQDTVNGDSYGSVRGEDAHACAGCWDDAPCNCKELRNGILLIENRSPQK